MKDKKDKTMNTSTVVALAVGTVAVVGITAYAFTAKAAKPKGPKLPKRTKMPKNPQVAVAPGVLPGTKLPGASERPQQVPQVPGVPAGEGGAIEPGGAASCHARPAGGVVVRARGYGRAAQL